MPNLSCEIRAEFLLFRLIYGLVFSAYKPHSFILLCLATCQYPFPNQLLHRVRCTASSLNLQDPPVSLRSANSCLRLLPRPPFTSILPSTFPSITCLRGQFLCQMWPIQLAFLLLFLVYSSPRWLCLWKLNLHFLGFRVFRSMSVKTIVLRHATPCIWFHPKSKEPAL